MRQYSFAGRASGQTNPEEVRVIEVDTGDSSPVQELDRRVENHTIIMWSGNEYSKNNTWIAGDEKSMIDLEDAR